MHPSDHAHAAFDARAMILKGVILAVDDTGQAQTVDVQTQDGFTRSGIEVEQLFGVASCPPVEGGTALLLAVGGDVGHYIALPLGNPSNRFGNLQAGDGGVLYAPDGSRVAVMNDGVVQIVGMAHVQVLAPNVSIQAMQGLALNANTSVDGDLTVSGTLSVSGDASVGGNLNVTGNVNCQHVNARD